MTKKRVSKKEKFCEQLFLVVPKLIEQPTWGGNYILQFKNWRKKRPFEKIKIGQSYELFSKSNLRSDIASSEDKSFTGELGYAMEPDKIFYEGDKNKLIPIEKVIKENPEKILGEKVVRLHGGKLKILNKFTQAKGNSFQIHVREKDSSQKWRFKPESWYYFEPGLLTLGIKKNADWKKYENACFETEKALKEISEKIKNKKMSIGEGKRLASRLIIKFNLLQYVNSVGAKKGSLIDLSCGGLHHSWEDNSRKYPLGNIVYELCLDIMDPVSVLRSFDKGKMKDDGSLRKLDIGSYFRYIDKSPKINSPMTHIKKSKTILKTKNVQREVLLRTKYYCLDKITLMTKALLENVQLNKSFHHLFVKSGSVFINSRDKNLLVSAGHSCFIPAAISSYSIKATGKEKAEVLATFVE